ncbi:MAG: HEAT repeat domain-containing protein [Gemmataceae bacterium]
MNNRWFVLGALAGLLAITAAGVAADPPGQPLKLEKSLKETLDGLLPGIGAEQGFEDAQRRWQEVCFLLSAPGREKQQAEAAQLMTDRLGTSLTPRARVWLLTQLMRTGRAECVTAVARSVDDADPLVRAAAVRALAAIPVAEAGKAVREKLASSSDAAVKVALINALGYRAEPASVAALARQLGDADAKVASAAATALGKVATSEAARAAAGDQAPAEVRGRIADARLHAATRLVRNGKAEEARALYAAAGRRTGAAAITPPWSDCCGRATIRRR